MLVKSSVPSLQDIYLREFRISDVDEFFNIAHDHQVKAFVPYAYTRFKQNAKKLIDNYVTYDFVNDFYFAIIHAESHKLVGAILSYRLAASKIIEVEYFIGKDYRVHGYMNKALKIFISYMANSTDYEALKFVVNPCNNLSIQILFSIGAVDPENSVYYYPLDWDRK